MEPLFGEVLFLFGNAQTLTPADHTFRYFRVSTSVGSSVSNGPRIPTVAAASQN